MTPHQQGRAAAEAGQPRTANPYAQPAARATGDAYPGEWTEWDWGWLNATATREHARRAGCQPLVSCQAPAEGA